LDAFFCGLLDFPTRPDATLPAGFCLSARTVFLLLAAILSVRLRKWCFRGFVVVILMMRRQQENKKFGEKV
jgi:hypothetical protein